MSDQQDEMRKAPGVERIYANDRIAVHWDPTLCIHIANCLRAQPGVFQPADRPWVHLEAASPDEIAAAVMLCPTGALAFRRLDGGPQEPRPATTTVDVRRNGPMLVRGSLEVSIPGEEPREMTRAALCRCGASGNKPFCDLSHRQIGFRG